MNSLGRIFFGLSICRVPCDHGHIPERSYALYKKLFLIKASNQRFAILSSPFALG